MLIIPPFINKFYIMDLNKKSMMRYLVENNQNIFLISWKNPKSDCKDFILKNILMTVFLKQLILRLE